VNIHQTETSARPHGSALFADILLHERQGATSIQAQPIRPERSRYHLVPNILLAGQNTGNTYYESFAAFRVQTDAGGEGISARLRERSLLVSRMDSFTKLPKDWGGEDTILVDRQTLEAAKRLVQELPHQWALPQATSSSDGEIAFTWFNGRNRLEALLQPDHHLIWVVQNDGQYAPGRDIDLGAIASFADLFEAIALFYK
jgi:hypothetical protein